MTAFFSYLEEAVTALWRNRARSGLTMLGMIIGSASIITVFGVSRAASGGIASTFASFGQLPVSVFPDPSQNYPQQAAIQYRDAKTVASALGDEAASVQPSWQRTYRITSATAHDYESVASDGGYHNDSMALLGGRRFTQQDIDGAARICMLTADLARKYFGTQPAVGNVLRVGGARFVVTGVYADIKGSFLNSILSSSAVFVPYSAFYQDFSPGSVDSLQVFAAQQDRADAVGAAAVAVLQHIHGTRSQYTVQNGAGFVSSFDGALSVIATGLSAIGGVALVVAGIGIMNIMLVSVTERTREIGIRKAIGATRGNIAMQFVMESVVLSLAGGGIGMLIGLVVTIGAASILSRQLGALLIPYLAIICIALTFSLVVGTLFGTYPAIRAARLDPIEALRT
ncbi:MAG TPA: ABC transporter permease [Candidatus Tumulicola sp.]